MFFAGIISVSSTIYEKREGSGRPKTCVSCGSGSPTLITVHLFLTTMTTDKEMANETLNGRARAYSAWGWYDYNLFFIYRDSCVLGKLTYIFVDYAYRYSFHGTFLNVYPSPVFIFCSMPELL
jgi:hypothetical protein